MEGSGFLVNAVVSWVCVDNWADVVVSDVESQHKSSSSLRYSRVSVDEMDVERMFDLTDDQHSSSADPLSPTDYTLQVDDDEEELNRLDTLP